MTEYEKKLEELRGICEWLQEHWEEVDKEDGAVIIAFEIPGKPFKACLSAGGNLLKLTALHMAILRTLDELKEEEQ